MEHALHLGKLGDDLHTILVGIPFVYDDRQIYFLCQFHLHPEGFFLDFPWDILIMVVKTDLADGLHLFVTAELSEFFQNFLIHLIAGIRVRTDRGL